MTEKVLKWLRGFTPFAGMMTDFLGVTPGCSGLYPKGQTRREQKKDIAGRVYAACSRVYLIRYRVIPGASAVATVESFSQWAEDSTAIPQLGENTRAVVKNAHLAAREQTGTAIYEMLLELTWEVSGSRGQTNLYKVNSKNLITPDAPVTVTVQTLEDPNSGYDESGVLHRYPLRNIRRWQFVYTGITQGEKDYLADLFPGVGSFLFLHPEGGGTPIRCYREDWSASQEAGGCWNCRFGVKEE